MKNFSKKSITIECPNCHVEVMKYDGISSGKKTARCPICLKEVTYNADSRVTKAEYPCRTCSSGMRFY